MIYEVEPPHEVQRQTCRKINVLYQLSDMQQRKFQAKLALVRVNQWNPKPILAVKRLVMLCRHGAVVGDDEMTVHLWYIQAHSRLNVIGILSWHASMNIWVSRNAHCHSAR